MENPENNESRLPANIGEDDQLQNVLGESKIVMEIMDESKEKVINLQHNLKQNESKFEELELHLKNFKDMSNQNTKHLEINENLMNTINVYNKQFMTFAGLVYSCGEALFKDCSIRKKELDQLEELLGKNDRKFHLHIKQLEVKEKQLQANAKHAEEISIKKKQKKMFSEQKNRDLLKELDRLNKEIGGVEEHLKNTITFDQEAELKNEIMLEECLKSTDGELLATAKALENLDVEELNVIKELKNNIVEVDKKIEEIKIEIAAKSEILETIIRTKIKEEKIKQFKLSLVDIDKKISDTEEIFSKEMALFATSIGAQEEALRIQKELNENLISIEQLIKNQTDGTKKEIKELNVFLDNIVKLPETALDTEIEKQEELKQTKIIRQQLKEAYKAKLAEQETLRKKIQDEITGLELTNKNLQEQSEKIESELNRVKTEKEEVMEEIGENETLRRELGIKIHNLNIEITKKKKLARFNVEAEKKEKKKKMMAPPKVDSVSKPKTLHNWDSDTSSMDGVDRSLSDRAMKKIQMMKKQQLKP